MGPQAFEVNGDSAEEVEKKFIDGMINVVPNGPIEAVEKRAMLAFMPGLVRWLHAERASGTSEEAMIIGGGAAIIGMIDNIASNAISHKCGPCHARAMLQIKIMIDAAVREKAEGILKERLSEIVARL